jgi:zinc transport system permease protein
MAIFPTGYCGPTRLPMIELFQYQFFVNALIAAILASIACGFIGTYIVTRRIVFISGGISHASFGGVGIGYFLGIHPLIGAAVFSLIAAMGIQTLSEKLEMRMDSMIGMLWSFGMAIGIIFVFITPGYASNLMVYLFGNILTVSHLDLLIMFGLTVIIGIVFFLFFREILYLAFDQDYARILGIPVSFLNYLLISLIAFTIVISIRIVGIILVIALLTIPQATASIFTKKFGTIILLSIGFGLATSIIGLFLSYQLNIPSGATIIFLSIMIFMLSKIFFRIFYGRPNQKKAI